MAICRIVYMRFNIIHSNTLTYIYMQNMQNMQKNIKYSFNNLGVA